ncbi:MAG: MFS transporter, partial [Dehalococcoidia bacterium]
MQHAAGAAAPSVAIAGQTVSDRHRWIAVAFICLALLVISLNNTLLNVALPSVAEDLNATDTQLQWVVDAYLLVFASLQLTMGTLGDGHGRKKALQFGLSVFLVVTILAGLSGTVQRLILLRGVMGIGAA